MNGRILCGLMVLTLQVTDGLRGQGEISVPKQLTLKAAKTLLMRYNPALQAKMLDIDIERGDVVDAEKYPNPTFGFDTTEGLEFGSRSDGFLETLQPAFILRQPILTAGKRKKRVRVEMDDTEIRSMEVHDLHRLLRFDLKQAYL